MQHVKVSWLRKFNYSLVGATVILFVMYSAFELLGTAEATKDRWGITPLILTIAAVHMVYVLITDRILIKGQPWLTSIISYVLYSFVIASIIETSGNTNIVYRAFFIISIFFTGMLGLYAPLTAIIFTWMLLVFTVTGVATPTDASLTFNIVVDSILTLSGLAGWYYFKRYYVTGKKEVQLQSKLQEEQFKTGVILESISDGVMIINTKGTVEILNQSTADLLGWERKDAEKLDYKSLIEPLGADGEETIEQDAITECIDTNKSVQRVSLLKTHHDRQVYIDIVASPITQQVRDGDSKMHMENVGIVAVLRDVDAQKRQEQQRSDFISTASHEMRTPVASIQGFIELALNKKVSTIDDKARGYLDKAYESTKHLGRLFQDLLTASKSDDGRLESHPKLINVQEFLEATIDKERTQTEKKGLTLKLSEQKTSGKQVSPLMFVNVDPERLQEVLNNLIENAIKYTKKGMVTVGASLQDQGVVIRVSDTGVGIATEDIPHLFQKFYRTDNSETREIGGTGLGLYISKQIVDSMGGRTWVESSLGNGSTFYVQIPRVSPEQLERLKQQSTPNAPA